MRYDDGSPVVLKPLWGERAIQGSLAVVPPVERMLELVLRAAVVVPLLPVILLLGALTGLLQLASQLGRGIDASRLVLLRLGHPFKAPSNRGAV